MRVRIRVLLFFLLAHGSVAAEHEARGRQGMVVAVSPPAVDVATTILRKGGNAVDAAVALGFAQAVTHPDAGNIGGGGYMVIWLGPGKEPVVIDYREVAPAQSTATMFVADPDTHSHKASGVPGTVAGFALAHRKFGKLPWRELVLPAVELAEKGFALTPYQAASLNRVVKAAVKQPIFRQYFGKDGGSKDWQPGDIFLQKELAQTLQRIADEGEAGFYAGTTAELIEKEMQAGGGLIVRADLAAYKAKERKPIHGTYRGFDIYSVAPSSSGGICLVQMLQMLENFDLSQYGPNSPETLHLLIEVMRRSFRDRAQYLGDPDFNDLPIRKLLDRRYTKELATSIDLKKATRSKDLAEEIPLIDGGGDTTHYSIADGNGMAVANTYTLENSYGSRVVVRGAGFLLNNEMFDFNWRPGVTNSKGQIGTEPNRIAPGKRMLSSQTPTIVVKEGKPFLVVGSPGGRTIINTTLRVIVNVIDFQLPLRAAVDAPRVHMQWFPDEVRFEGVEKYPEAVLRLREMGHKILPAKQGDAHAIRIDPKTGELLGVADKRLDGKAAGY